MMVRASSASVASRAPSSLRPHSGSTRSDGERSRDKTVLIAPIICGAPRLNSRGPFCVFGGTRRSVSSLPTPPKQPFQAAKAGRQGFGMPPIGSGRRVGGHPLRIPPQLDSCGFLCRLVKSPTPETRSASRFTNDEYRGGVSAVAVGALMKNVD